MEIEERARVAWFRTVLLRRSHKRVGLAAAGDPGHDPDQDGVPELAPGTADVLQAATRMLAGVALRSLDALDAAVTLPQFRPLAVLADLGPVPVRACWSAPQATTTDWPRIPTFRRSPVPGTL
jgi:hypothetical protein